VKRFILVAGLLAAGLLVSVKPASADTLHYVVSGLIGTATFDLQRTPNLVSFTTGQDFLVTVTSGTSNLWGYNFLLPPFTLQFSNLAYGGGFGLVIPILGNLQLSGAQMFSGPDSAPFLSTGIFQLAYNTTVTVTSTPEPSTLLLLGFGLVALAIFRKRYASA